MEVLALPLPRHGRTCSGHPYGLSVRITALTVFGKGDLIEPTADQLCEVFKQLVVGLNDIGIRYYGEDPGFEWGRRLNA